MKCRMSEQKQERLKDDGNDAEASFVIFGKERKLEVERPATHSRQP